MFKKEGFGRKLSQIRKAHKLSQLDFIAQLANAHKEFSDITQTTLSLWENGKREPSFLRRIAIARFFAAEYEMDEAEQKLMDKTKMIDLGHRPSFYPMAMSGITSVSFFDLTETQRNIVKQGHLIAYNEALTETMAAFPPSDYNVDLFMNENTIIGHYVANKAGLVVSFCSIDSMIAITMTLALSKRFTAVIIPIRVPAIASFFQDLHFEPYPTASIINFYKGNLQALLSNPFFKDLLNKNASLVRLSKAQKG
ncbi:MAG: transcriptional regulator [Moritella sp.]|nr:MAG: transcriptional regulator [Moritella sp.]